MNPHAAQARLDQLTREVAAKTLNGTVTNKFMDEVEAESERLETVIKNHRAASQWAGFASPAEFGLENANPGDYDHGPTFKGFGPGMENRIRPTSMYEMDKSQINALQQAAPQGTRSRCRSAPRASSTAISAAGSAESRRHRSRLNAEFAAPIQQYGPQGWLGLPYENDARGEFPGRTWQDRAPASPGSGTARTAGRGRIYRRGCDKPDLSPVILEQYTRFVRWPADHLPLTRSCRTPVTPSRRLVADLAAVLYNAESICSSTAQWAPTGLLGSTRFQGRSPDPRHRLAAGLPVQSFQDLRQAFFPPDL